MCCKRLQISNLQYLFIARISIHERFMFLFIGFENKIRGGVAMKNVKQISEQENNAICMIVMILEGFI